MTAIQTPSVGETHRPLRADARRNRERIIESARRVFADDGADAQIDDVAREAGVGVGTVYRHFPNKEALMVELVRQKFQLFADRAREALEQDGEPFGALEDVMRRNAESSAEDAAARHAMATAGEHIWEQIGPEQSELIALTQDLIERAKRVGTIRADAHANDVAMLMCGVCSTMGRGIPGFDWRRHVDLAVESLRPHQG